MPHSNEAQIKGLLIYHPRTSLMHQAVSEALPDHHQSRLSLWDPPAQSICQLQAAHAQGLLEECLAMTGKK